MSKILVTGGAGFLGSHLCKRLLDDGHEVTAMDNFQTGRMTNIESMHPNSEMKKGMPFSVVEHDIINPYPMMSVDMIFNLACAASPPAYQNDPIHTTKTNVYGMINMLEIARANECPIMQASTSEVYGDPTITPQPETYVGNVNPNGIRSCYDEGKRAAESLCYDYHRQYNVDVKVARIFNTYGPQMDPLDGRVVSNFIMQALRGDNITIYGDGTQTRSFQYVDDLIEGFMSLMSKAEIGDGPFNLGNPVEFTIRELAEVVIELVGSKSKVKIINMALPSDDPKQRCPDISKAKKYLDWEPKVSLNEGLIKTIEYFKQYV